MILIDGWDYLMTNNEKIIFISSANEEDLISVPLHTNRETSTPIMSGKINKLLRTIDNPLPIA